MPLATAFLSEASVRALAGETGYAPGPFEKAARLLDLLGAFAAHPFLSRRLVLKGGTALNLFHLPIARLSMDADLNYIGSLEREEMLRERPRIEAAVERVLAARGCSVRHRPTEHAGGKWRSRYASALGGGANLELDIAYVAREPLFGAPTMDSHPLGCVRAEAVPVLDIHEVVAGKLVALVERNAARDLFDARSIAAMEGLDRARLRTAFVALGASARRDWRTVSTAEIEGNPQDFHDRLMICLPIAAFPNRAAIAAWIEETVALCRERLGFLFEYTEGERAFLDGVLERGEVRAELLDAGPEVQRRVAAMPMLGWKCRQVRKRRGLPPAPGR